MHSDVIGQRMQTAWLLSCAQQDIEMATLEAVTVGDCKFPMPEFKHIGFAPQACSAPFTNIVCEVAKPKPEFGLPKIAQSTASFAANQKQPA